MTTPLQQLSQKSTTYQIRSATKMFFAVEGGGFFSSSASGYANGLALLVLGRRNEQKPIKVSSWNHYRLVSQEVETGFQLNSRNIQASCVSASFSCFGGTPARLDETSCGNADWQSKTLPDSSSSERSKVGISLKNNIRKPSKDHSVVYKDNEDCELLEEVENKTSCCTVRRKVQWTDKCGKELAEIREFVISDDDISDDEYEGRKFRRCVCTIQ